MTARKLFAKIHLWLSIPLGLIISVICFSGAMLVFEKDIAGLLHRELYRVEVPDGAEAMRPSELARRVMEQMPRWHPALRDGLPVRWQASVGIPVGSTSQADTFKR